LLSRAFCSPRARRPRAQQQQPAAEAAVSQQHARHAATPHIRPNGVDRCGTEGSGGGSARGRGQCHCGCGGVRGATCGQCGGGCGGGGGGGGGGCGCSGALLQPSLDAASVGPPSEEHQYGRGVPRRADGRTVRVRTARRRASPSKHSSNRMCRASGMHSLDCMHISCAH
jgi:hypothetical protein